MLVLKPLRLAATSSVPSFLTSTAKQKLLSNLKLGTLEEMSKGIQNLLGAQNFLSNVIVHRGLAVLSYLVGTQT